MRRSLRGIMLFAALFVVPAIIYAQTTASVNGTISDPSDAVIPGAIILLANASTGVHYEVKSDAAGSYRFANVPPGPGYSMQFSAQGFSPLKVNDIYVNVANSRLQNAKLSPGTATVEVQVVDTSDVTLNTTDGSVGNNFQISKLQDLPVYDRSSPGVLFTLQPGITSSGATTGARTDQNNVTVDGLDVNDAYNGGFAIITSGAPVDSIQEFRGTTAGFTAANGPGSGGQFQLVTRSGTNQWHGNINEYHRDNSTTANNWFNANAGVPQPELVQNQFGGSVGGPILHDKLFFFFNFLGSRIAQQSAQERTVPLPSFAAGTISYMNNNPGCTDATRQNTTPNCVSSLSPAQVRQMDPAGVGESPQILALFKNRYPAPNDLTSGDGLNSAGFRFNSPVPDNHTVYTGRVDYGLTSKIKIFGIGNVSRENQVTGAQQFPGDAPSQQFVDRSYRYAAGMNWEISQSKFNQLTYGSVVADYNYAQPSNPEGLYQIGFGNGFTPTLVDNPYSSPSGSSNRHVVTSQVNDNFTWNLGNHQMQLGGYFKWIHFMVDTTSGYDGYSIGLGGHIFSTPGLEPANILPSDSTASEYYDNAFVSSLGRVASTSGTFNYDAGGNVLAQPSSSARKWLDFQTQPYISDSWKIKPNLTINAGLNYQFFTVPYETQGLETIQTTGFDEYFAAREAQSAAGASGNSAVPFVTYVLGGKKNNGPGFYKSNLHDFAPHVGFAYSPSFDSSTVFNGSASMVYDRTVINAILNQQIQFSYLFQQNVTNQNGNNSDATGSVGTDPRIASAPTVTAPATPKTPFQPWVTAGVPVGLQGGQFNTTVDPNLKTPYSILLSFGMQHQFQGSMVLKVNYVGRLGRRLLAQADAAQLIDFTDAASQQTMNQAMQNIEREVRAGRDPANLPAEPWFEHQLPSGYNGKLPNKTSAAASSNPNLVEIGDFADFIQALSPNLQPNVGMSAQFGENTIFTNKGFSSYNGLLVTLQKNLSHGIQFDVNYTWSHSIDNTSEVAADGAASGYGFVCDAVHPRECRGNSDFDTKHYLTSDFTYSLPLGRGKAFFGTLPRVADELIGGWSVSGIPSWHSGQAWSPLSNAFVAGFSNDAPAIFNGDTHAVRRGIHKEPNGSVSVFADPAAAVAAFSGPVGLTIGSRNILRGPQYFNMDAGLAKTFALIPDRNVNFKFRADAFNVLNHPNFDDLDYGSYGGNDNITATTNFGQLTATNGNPRVLQLSGRIEF
ncbi:carboxypeptidase-like regulatory domain-containing protein [Granulicella arctica]|uniref:carboxypeptidase-like regulatory domain-containing protein n=1 Tax=Granulicella arctica TaxID=940613 RepID=UPI0021DFEA8E|nr:carboxypeptidase-like regulatory domain-containing protein [Granulicella arctica]